MTVVNLKVVDLELTFASLNGVNMDDETVLGKQCAAAAQFTGCRPARADDPERVLCRRSNRRVTYANVKHLIGGTFERLSD
jgi:hypothetical protein